MKHEGLWAWNIYHYFTHHLDHFWLTHKGVNLMGKTTPYSLISFRDICETWFNSGLFYTRKLPKLQIESNSIKKNVAIWETFLSAPFLPSSTSIPYWFRFEVLYTYSNTEYWQHRAYIHTFSSLIISSLNIETKPSLPFYSKGLAECFAHNWNSVNVC